MQVESIKIELPEKVRYILQTISAAGYEAYVVGGCVRDSILGNVPKDWDITTSAKPQEIKKLFRRTIDTGIQHGTVTVMLEKEGFEITTYRIDGKYEDGRHPKEVTFTPNLREDLTRRDFTINAMAYNDEEGLVDLFGGLSDIDQGVIRCVGDARQRFLEDALRIMRAVRFSAALGYAVDEQTKEAIRELAPTLSKISAERIQMELTKLLTSPHPDFLRAAYEMGITKVILPEFDKAMATKQNHPHHQYSVGEHILHSLLFVEPDKVLRLAMLFHDIGKPETMTVDDQGIHHFHGHAAVGEKMTKAILRRLRYDNETIDQVSRLVYFHDCTLGAKPDLRMVRRAMHRVGEDLFPALFSVSYADIMAQSLYKRDEKLDMLAQWKQGYEEVCRQKQCVSLKQLAVTGKDLIALGMQPGPGIGEMLQALLELVLDDPSCNTKEYLVEKAKKSS